MSSSKPLTAQAKYYKKRMQNDENFYANEKVRIYEYIKNRYNNDQEFRNKRNEISKQYYYRKKAERLQQQQQQE